jgi:hypothetical protein
MNEFVAYETFFPDPLYFIGKVAEGKRHVYLLNSIVRLRIVCTVRRLFRRIAAWHFVERGIKSRSMGMLRACRNWRILAAGFD